MILCQGAYAKTPYYIADDCVNIYSIEELCYYLYHNAYLLDDRIVTAELVEWIDKELELPKVAGEIGKVLGKGDALSKLVAILSNNIGYYEEEKWVDLLKEIGRNNRLSIEERRKIRADGFMDSGRIALAMEEYETVIRDTRPNQTILRAKVYHNLGVCSAKLFMYQAAAEYFEKAYATYANTDSYVSMLCAMKLYMKPTEYLEYLAAHKESYEDSLDVERKCELVKIDWNRQPIRKFFTELSAMKQQGAAYYDGILSMAEEVKEEYRDNMFRNANS